MKNPPFNYHRPSTVAEALGLLAKHGDEAKILAGGQSLLPVMALRLGQPEHLIDIGAIDELKQITATDGGVAIAAMVRHAEAENSADVSAKAPLVAAALPHVGHRAIRNRGTVVGSIAHADAAAELPAVCLATNATMHIASIKGTREVAAADFFEGFFATALTPTELLTHVRFPASPATTGSAVVEVSRRHGDYAMCGLACAIDVSGDTINTAALAFFGVAGTAIRVAEAEAALLGQPPSSEAFAAAADIVATSLDPSGDIHATANYRKHVAATLTRRGLAEALSSIGVPA